MEEVETSEKDYSIGIILIMTLIATMFLSVFGTILGLLVIYMSHQDAVREIERLRKRVQTQQHFTTQTTA